MTILTAADPGAPGRARLVRFAHRFGPEPRPRALEEGWRAVAEALAREGLELIQEKAYGELGLHAEAVAARRRALGAARAEEMPWSFVGVGPGAGDDALALEGIAIAGAGASVRTVTREGRAVGRHFDDGVARGLLLADLAAGTGPAATPAIAGRGLERAFRDGFELAAEAGFEPSDLARTWIYLDPLLEHYDELNRMRNALFAELGLRGGSGATAPPASTGIQGAHPSGAPGMLELAFFAASRPGAAHPVTRVGAAEQCEAWSYGSAFSRAARVELAGGTLVYLSGTASIGPDGRTEHVGDPIAQLRTTFEVARGVLERSGASFESALGGVLFLKSPEADAAWRTLSARGELPELPLFAVRADVCRADLLVELELTASVPR